MIRGKVKKLNLLGFMDIQQKSTQILKTSLLVIWRFYQIAIGALLILIFVGLMRTADYFKVFDVLDLEDTTPEMTAFMSNEYDRLFEEYLQNNKEGDKPRISYTWVDIDSIPMLIQELVLVAEDAKFYQHDGFDFSEIEYAIVANHQKGVRARGASTISQQLVKNLFLSSKKRMSRKIREAGITAVLENFLTKERILELYLNVAQFGPGVFGVYEGAEYHYGKPLQELTIKECARLVAVIPGPMIWDVKSRRKSYRRHKSRVLKNYALLKGMKHSVDFSEETWKEEVFKQLAEVVEEAKWGRLLTKPKSIRKTTDSSNQNGNSATLNSQESSGSKNKRKRRNR